ncbi:phosphatidylserine decarboxylase [Lentibacillus sp. N15]|uniref:phosphatidylserine decarboxylase n=1 Tax=Lentibacillus songyuanensis TaxID=3136161 RepID=UPI0031B9D796
MLKKLFTCFVELTGNQLASTLLKTYTRSSLSRPLIRPFLTIYGINQDEIELPIHHYKSLHAFFTRRLITNTRPVDLSESALIAPVDGIVSDMGKITGKDQRFTIKNQHYTVSDVLGGKNEESTYQNGYFYILYLSPRHYHRIHYPINGQLLHRYALGGTSFPVNNLGLRWGKAPFSTNYRIISELSTAFGRMAMIKIGALNINSIHLLHAQDTFNKADEVGYFSFGSTVVLFIEQNSHFQPAVIPGTEVAMGQTIGEWN